MVQQISRPEPGEKDDLSECRHHWIIESPTGPVSRGICRLCDAIREFKNYIDAVPWGEESSSQTSPKYAAVGVSSESFEEQVEG